MTLLLSHAMDDRMHVIETQSPLGRLLPAICLQAPKPLGPFACLDLLHGHAKKLAPVSVAVTTNEAFQARDVLLGN
jgi:hypothetical protein